MLSTSYSVKEQMIVAIATVLQFSPKEVGHSILYPALPPQSVEPHKAFKFVAHVYSHELLTNGIAGEIHYM